jgi:phosphosulfolactate phosphohydrolase-like enzyme
VGFDFGNSPTEVEASELPWDARIVVSTTNDTRVIQAARGTPALLAGAFVKTHAVADELADSMYGTRVAAIGCGWEGRGSGEDETAQALLFTVCRTKAPNSVKGRKVLWAYTSHVPKSPPAEQRYPASQAPRS